MLRIKANYLWPGKWDLSSLFGCANLLIMKQLCGAGTADITRCLSTQNPFTKNDLRSAFAIDDSLNQPLADLYGIVMGTRSVFLSICTKLTEFITNTVLTMKS